MGEQKIADPTNPSYYKDGLTSMECIEAMELTFDRYDIQAFCVCNAYKYIWRHRNKNGLEDLNKAQWYLNKAKSLYSGQSDDPWSSDVDKLQELLDKKKKQWQESH